jgi:hypothetical protein
MFRSEENSIKTLYDLTGVSSELEIPLSSDRTSNRNLLKSKEFENNMLMFILTSIKTETLHYNPLMQSIDEILKTIDNEIKE